MNDPVSPSGDEKDGRDRPTDAFRAPSKPEIVALLRDHPLIRLREDVLNAYLVGSFCTGQQNPQSDVDVLLEVTPPGNCSAEELEEKYRQLLRQYFVTNNIRGKADFIHPQWWGRRVDVYFTYDATKETRPKLLLVNCPDSEVTFDKWIQGTKVVDASGQPLRVYHGTGAAFDAFDPNRSGRNYPQTGGCKGFFFTSNPGTASVYAEKTSFANLDPQKAPSDFGNGTANIRPVYLSMRAPVIARTEISPDKYFDRNRETLYRRAHEKAADGIIVRGGAAFKRDLFVVFEPSQIRTAIGVHANPNTRCSSGDVELDPQRADRQRG